MAARVKTGTTTWAERSLLATGWYPPQVRTARERLRYYASQFAVVENDSSYWAVPSPEQVQVWAETAPPDFTMNMKAHALLTGHYTDPRRLPKDIREALPRKQSARRRVYPRHLGDEVMREIRQRFHDALAPLHESGNLGVVLLQFPVWFPISRENKAYLARIREQLLPYRAAVELRNHTWMTAENRHETLSLLAAEGLAYTCVDEPQGFPSSVPPIAAATSELAIVRMHGRNAARWAGPSGSAAERFDYLYPVRELREWVPKVLQLAEETREVHVLMNNCYSDYAVRNARQMSELLEQAQGTLEHRSGEQLGG